MGNNEELQQINLMPRIGDMASDFESATTRGFMQRTIYISTY